MNIALTNIRFTNRCASHCADIHRCCVRCFPATARTLLGSCRLLRRTQREMLRDLPTVCFASATRTASRFANTMLTWMLRDVLRRMPTILLTQLLTLIPLRGWCLSKMFRFSISENHRHLHSIELVKLGDDWRSERPFLKSERTQRLWSRGILETDVGCAAV